MCIICNCGLDTGDEFLNKFKQASDAMKKSCDAMLRCSEVAGSSEDRKRYDHTHKKMVRLLRDWNRIEQERESK